ncbi:hypothetical protein [Planococcus koreensis]|uniref:hypothetical protein n=1 Tax=Planococcus koreensis TaxID=112331 RepID=UPI0039FD05DB
MNSFAVQITSRAYFGATGRISALAERISSFIERISHAMGVFVSACLKGALLLGK